ncbi:CoA transferase [Leptospira noguchii]|uniref:CoA-transferase family III protein n=8 Tax=Leptospira noguchii TaxID=28182 RepID=M6YCC4_9LEPT|nr:CoA transferase [Leptospira noguchii]EPE86323.1 CoA-transferase family III protein [Leptospira noguchii str. 1993005606]EMN01664.1 CoA-transferase family III protein [Leptospira noguchii str. 2007001578]EMO87304.1 CoA-transferase family III protein [Leptospira noguchii str. 2001034031]TQE83611.1 CoA transferase [Leptospira noguchii]UOG33491.1 CoA transferase [Leptospira noguchii]
MNQGPLSGIKVIDLSLLLPGPLCSMYLGDMGAEVIKVENPRAMDATRVMFKKANGAPSLYLMLNRNKKAITLNLKKEKSREILFKLLENADVLLEGFRPDGLAKMGYGYDDLKERFPKLIYCGIYGYGTEGKYRNFAGHDVNYLSLSGVLSQTGKTPQIPGYQLADIGGGTMTALSSILAALYAREKTGKGQKISVSMMDSSLQFLSLYGGIYGATGKNPEGGNELLSGKLPNYNVYQTKEGRWVALGALEDMFFKTFLRQSGLDKHLEEFPAEEKNFLKWKEILTTYFSTKTFEDLNVLFENEDSCLTPVKTIEEVIKDPVFQESGMVMKKKHPDYGDYFQFGAPFSFSETTVTYRLDPPSHGEHNESIYRTLGYTVEEIETMKKEKVI